VSPATPGHWQGRLPPMDARRPWPQYEMGKEERKKR